MDTPQACIDFLKQTNYYRLSAYFLPFRRRDGGHYKGIDFKRIQRIYGFDSRIRALLFQAIEQIELYMRSTLSYYIAHKYGALGYLKRAYKMDRKLFSKIIMLKNMFPDREIWNSRFATEIETLINEYLPDISLRHIGFPENWNDLLFA